MPSFAVENFGCRASAADGDAIAEALTSASLATESWRTASVVVVNTCAVTAAAERDARAAIRRIHRENPAARVVVTGCYAQRAPEELRSLPGVAEVLGNAEKGKVPAAALRHFQTEQRTSPVEPEKNEDPLPNPYAALRAAPRKAQLLPVSAIAPAPRNPNRSVAATHLPLEAPWHLGNPQTGSVMHTASFDWNASPLPLSTGAGLRTRPVLKVQEGCANRCSFCVIPETRGPSRSVTLAQALEAARAFATRGGQELVLSGINLGRWGAELQPRRTLAELVRALLEETSLPRLRLSSIEPMDWTQGLLTLVQRYACGEHPRLAPHAHLPLQSGADAILRSMHRRYRPWHYAEKLWALQAASPGIAIGADVMVGFPGETDALFGESLRLIESLPLTYLHLFPFSPRPRTGAERMHRELPVASRSVRERMRVLHALDHARRRQFARRFLGQSLSAVTLAGEQALTANYLHVKVQPGSLPNRLVTVRLASIQEGTELQAVETHS